MESINSDSYWSTRFAEDWESLQGPAQSRFFVRLAIEHLPRWLIEQLQHQPLTLVDWGCAQGDGTDVWASYIDSRRIIGVDFSSVAIEQAAKRYPAIRFIDEDWLAGQPAEQELFDVVFSSNTLEHFHRPSDVLSTLCERATKALVLVLPYRELDRHQEHFYTFLPDNIPATIGRKFRLIWSQVVDCRELPNTLWGGEQIILVYAELNWIESLGLTLRDLCIEQIDSVVEIASLNQAVAERDGQIANLNQIVIERNLTIVEMTSALAASQQQVEDLLSSTSWKITAVLRLAKRFVAKGGVLSPTQRYQLLKAAYWKLPQGLQIRLNGYRHRYVARRFSADTNKFHANSQDTSHKNHHTSEWIRRIESSQQIAIISCAFEFDELVNQRPINAAKYYAQSGFLVLYVAWQWSPREPLKKGNGEVAANILQVPMYEFFANTEDINYSDKIVRYIVTLPSRAFIDIVDLLRQQAVVIYYDIMDEWEEFHRVGQAPWYEKTLEESLVLKADIVTAVSPALVQKFSSLRTDIYIIGNGFTPTVLGLENRNIARRQSTNNLTIGYFGHLTDAWFDWKLLFDLAEKLPEASFEIIGYGQPDWASDKVLAHKNIRLLGKVPPAQLHQHVANWSAGIIPFSHSALSEAVDPIKIYEYMYFGLPVVVTGIPHVSKYPRTFYATRENIADTVQHALTDRTPQSTVDAFLEESTWQARFNTMEDISKKSKGLWLLYEH